MKIKKFLDSIEVFFMKNKKEISSLQDALGKLEEKKVKLLKKLKDEDFKDDDKENLKNKLNMVKELEKKITKKLEKELNKLNSKKNIE